MRRVIILLLSVVTVFAVASLAAGADYLGAVLPGGLPLGNVLAALALCAPAGVAVGLGPAGTAVRRVALASLIAAIAWLPVSIALAGNLLLNFEGWRGLAWEALSLVVTVCVLGTLAWASAAALLARHGRIGEA